MPFVDLYDIHEQVIRETADALVSTGKISELKSDIIFAVFGKEGNRDH
jgi:hypothetical protein